MKKEKRQWVVDLGTELTKIISGYRNEAGIVQIENYWIEKTPKDVFNEGMPEKKIDLVVFLRTLLKGHSRKDDLMLVLNHRKMIVSSFAYPMMTQEDLKKAVKWEMQVMIPEKLAEWDSAYHEISNATKAKATEKIDDWRIDYLAKERIERFEYLGFDDKKIDALGIAVQKELLDAYCRVFKSTKHALKRIEPQFYGYGKLLDAEAKRMDLLIDMGQTGARLMFYDKGFLQEERRIETRVSSDLDGYLAPIVKGIMDSFQSPLGIARGYEKSNIYLLGGESIKDGVLASIGAKINKEIKSLSCFLENQQLFRFPEEITKDEICLLLPCLSGMLR
ncbi:hypothetical protein GH808_05305 [Acetobacterium fimetarium]|uniref:Competence protein A n=1 Tax=Acetobacterium fimetarium TaxID=52691 RepID=A0ABR6WTF5_9FIRM|nr:hypothetical protein [Acetobacterium fimetarium]MBC3803852.1 hypothetical protein [Acetobacterium fimetarium]